MCRMISLKYLHKADGVITILPGWSEVYGTGRLRALSWVLLQQTLANPDEVGERSSRLMKQKIARKDKKKP
jgi:hypothetical protein